MCSTGTGVGVGVGMAVAGAGDGSKLSILGVGALEAVCAECEPLRATAFDALTECVFAVGITAAGPPTGALAIPAGAGVAGVGVVGAGVGAVAAG